MIQVDKRGENLGRRTRVDLGLIGDVKATLNAAMSKITPKTDGAHLKKFTDHYAKVREGLDELAVGHPGRKPPSAVPREDGRRSRQRRRYLHLRRRHAHDLGRALPDHERQATPARFVQPRLHGQRHAAGHRRATGIPGPAGGDVLRRRRTGHAARRPALDEAAQDAG